MYQNLIKDWNKTPKDLAEVGKQLTKMKIALTELQFMPTNGTPTPQELVLARDVLEIGVQWSVQMGDIPSFERYMSQLKCYYFDYSGVIPDSPLLNQLLGLNLMCLLAQNRLSEFHTELELLPPKDLQENVYIRCPVSLEQHLMEGNYSKIYLTKDNVPCADYSFFINILVETLRDEIADCVEKSYENISIAEASRMLMFKTDKEIKAYASKRGWSTHFNNFVFKHAVETTEHIQSVKLIQNFLGYAKELERIV